MTEDTRDLTSQAETALTTADYFERYGQAASGRRFVGDLLKFGKDGVYVAGQECREIKLGTRVVACMRSLRVGWLRWENAYPFEGPSGLLADGFVLPKRDTLANTPDESTWERNDKGVPINPWQVSNDLVMYNPQARQFYTFATTAKGGLSAIGELAKEYAHHWRQHPEELPSVLLKGGSYLHRDRSRGRIHYPIFSDIQWVPASSVPALDGAGQPQIEQDQDLPGF